MDHYKAEKKPVTSSYQQSFRIDDLLTRRVNDQQPDHFGKLPSPETGSQEPTSSGNSIQQSDRVSSYPKTNTADNKLGECRALWGECAYILATT